MLPRGTYANMIRDHVYNVYIAPARERHVEIVTILVGDVIRALKMQHRIPSICGALEAKRFCIDHSLKLLSRTGPRNGWTTLYTFKV